MPDFSIKVTIDKELKFSTHAEKSVDGASSTIGLIKSTLSSHSAKIIRFLHKQLVHPKLEAGMSLASPYFKRHKHFGRCAETCYQSDI